MLAKDTVYDCRHDMRHVLHLTVEREQIEEVILLKDEDGLICVWNGVNEVFEFCPTYDTMQHFIDTTSVKLSVHSLSG